MSFACACRCARHHRLLADRLAVDLYVAIGSPAFAFANRVAYTVILVPITAYDLWDLVYLGRQAR